MALINPSNLYSGGTAVLDSTPYLRMALQQRARKQAMEDAMYQHYSELPNKINTAGVRYQDLDNEYGGINQDLNKARDYWIQNKAAIMKGGVEQQNYNKMLQGVSQAADQSKQAAKMQLQIGQSFFSGKHKPRGKDLEISNAIDQPIQSPHHYKNADIRQPYEITDFSVGAPNYDSNKQKQYDAAVIGKIKPQKLLHQEEDPVTLKVRNTYGYQPEHIAQAAQNAAQIVDDDQTLYNHFEGLMDNPEYIKTASEALSKIKGQPVIVQTPQELAAGLKAAELSAATEKADETNLAAINAFKADQQAKRLAAALKKQREAEAGKNARTKALVEGVQVTDVLGKAELNAKPTDVPLDLALKGVTTLIPVDAMDEREQTDIFGKADKYGERPIKPIVIDGKNYIAKTGEGKYKAAPTEGGDLSTIDPDAVITSTWLREKDLKKSIQSGKVKEPSKVKGTNQRLY